MNTSEIKQTIRYFKEHWREGVSGTLILALITACGGTAKEITPTTPPEGARPSVVTPPEPTSTPQILVTRESGPGSVYGEPLPTEGYRCTPHATGAAGNYIWELTLIVWHPEKGLTSKPGADGISVPGVRISLPEEINLDDPEDVQKRFWYEIETPIYPSNASVPPPVGGVEMIVEVYVADATKGWGAFGCDIKQITVLP